MSTNIFQCESLSISVVGRSCDGCNAPRPVFQITGHGDNDDGTTGTTYRYVYLCEVCIEAVALRVAGHMRNAGHANAT